MHTDPPIDQPTAVREGEMLDTEALAGYLRQHLSASDGALTVEQFPSGFSNLTYLLHLGARELVLRRPPLGVAGKHAHDMGREYRILAALIAVYPKVPRPLLYCEDVSVLGAPFYVMERVQGIILRTRPPEQFDLTPELMRRVCLALIDTQVELHALNYQATGLGNLGRPAGYTERQVSGWLKRYAAARTDDIPELEQAAAWMQQHIPAHTDSALIHNDFRYDNVVLDPTDPARILAVLDWELATLGDPLTDVGTTLAYWAEPDDPAELRNFGLTTLPGNLSREQYVQHYAAQSGRDVSNMLFYFVYGLYKNAVIIQQIYTRYQQGLTQDARFANLINMVRMYGLMAVRAIEQQKISSLFS